MAERVAPNSYQDEQAVLGSCMIDTKAYSAVMSILTEDSFYYPKHATVWRAIESIVQRGAIPDLITVVSELRKMEQLDAVGGDIYLDELMDSVPIPDNIRSYANTVHEHYQRRRIAEIMAEAAESVCAPDADSETIITKAQIEIDRLRQHGSSRVVSIAEAVQDQLADMEQLRDVDNFRGVCTFWTDIDEIAGNWLPGNLIVLGAGTKVGKTAFALDTSRRMAERGVNIGYWSSEMTASELAARAISASASEHSELDLPYSRILSNPHFVSHNWDQLGESASNLIKRIRARFNVYDNFEADAGQVFAEFMRMRAKDNGRWMFVVDRFDMLESPPSAHKRFSQRERFEDLIRYLKRAAKKLQAPILVTSQLNRAYENTLRASETDVEPEPMDLFGSSEIEKTADKLLFLYRPKQEDAQIIRRVIVRLNRQGPTGTRSLLFYPQYGRFANKDELQHGSTPF